MKKINVLNLSIGGPDFMDRPFVDKVIFNTEYADTCIAQLCNVAVAEFSFQLVTKTIFC